MTLAAEWIKFRTLRSSYWALALAVTVALAIAILAFPSVIGRWEPSRSPDQAGLGVVAVAFFGVILSQLVLGVLGVITMTAEHSSRMIDVTYAAMPARARVLLAKAVVLIGVSLVTTVAIGVPGILYGRLVAAPYSPSWMPAQGWRLLGGAALVLTMTALLGLALGAVLRRGAAAITTLMALVFVVPLIVFGLPAPWGERIAAYLPTPAALQLLGQAPPLMSTGTAFAVCAAYAVVPLLLALGITAWPRAH